MITTIENGKRTRYCMGIAIMPTLKRIRDGENMADCFSDKGKPVSNSEVASALIKELHKGYKIFCGCDSRTEDGSCAGHPLDE
jgi:hypothetical protein